MLHFSAGAFGFEVRSFQLKIPLCRSVGVVDQHEVGIMLQSFGLHFHRAAVLLDKFREDKFQETRHEWNPAKQVPGGDDVDATLSARDRSNRRQAREPIFAGTNRLGAQVRQYEIDGR